MVQPPPFQHEQQQNINLNETCFIFLSTLLTNNNPNPILCIIRYYNSSNSKRLNLDSIPSHRRLDRSLSK